MRQDKRVIQVIQLLTLASIIALATAYIAQYLFGLKPCALCLYQRIPYAVIIVMGLAAFPFRSAPRILRGIMWLCFVLMIVELGAAGYHVGVEYGVFEGLEGCSGAVSDRPLTLEEIREQLMAETEAVRCDTPAFMFLGLSMAGWNKVYALALLLVSVLILMKKREK